MTPASSSSAGAHALRIVLALLAALAIAGAVVLEAIGAPAVAAWTAAGSIVGLLAGQHLDKPA